MTVPSTTSIARLRASTLALVKTSVMVFLSCSSRSIMTNLRRFWDLFRGNAPPEPLLPAAMACYGRGNEDNRGGDGCLGLWQDHGRGHARRPVERAFPRGR